MDGLQPRPLSLHGLYLEDMRIICVGTMGYRWPTNHVNPFIHLPIHPSFIHSAGHHLLILLFIHLSISTSTHLLPSFCLPSSHFLLYLLFIPLSTHPPIHPSVPLCSHTYIHPPIFSFSFLYIHLSFHSCTSPSHVRHCARHRGTRIQRARLYLQVCNVCLCTCLC